MFSYVNRALLIHSSFFVESFQVFYVVGDFTFVTCVGKFDDDRPHYFNSRSVVLT